MRGGEGGRGLVECRVQTELHVGWEGSHNFFNKCVVRCPLFIQ